jgi:hypothetical protein
VLVENCDRSQAYFELINGRITVELTKDCPHGRLSKAREILNCAMICLSTDEISEAGFENVCKRIFGICPQFEEKLKNELTEKFAKIQ